MDAHAMAHSVHVVGIYKPLLFATPPTHLNDVKSYFHCWTVHERLHGVWVNQPAICCPGCLMVRRQDVPADKSREYRA